VVFIKIKLLQLLAFSSFQLFCAEIVITPVDLFNQLDRAVKAQNKVEIENLFSHPLQKKLTSNQRNSLLERSLFFHTHKEMALFLLEKQEILKANRLGIHDILRLSVSTERSDVTAFVLFQISNEQLEPEKDVIIDCSNNARPRKNLELIEIFSNYLSAKPQNSEDVTASSIVTGTFAAMSNQQEKTKELTDFNPATAATLTVVPDQREQEQIEAHQSIFSNLLTIFWNNISIK
jgi:hypothetical protein